MHVRRANQVKTVEPAQADPSSTWADFSQSPTQDRPQERLGGSTLNRRADVGVGRRLGLGFIALFAMSLGLACSGEGPRAGSPVDPAQGGAKDAAAAGAAEVAASSWDDELDPGPITKTSMRGHERGSAWVIDPEVLDEPRELDVAQAEARGYTVIDLGDRWRPFIFTHATPGLEDESTNTYAAKYIGLANDEIDHDGDPLAEHGHNYLELYGIPPALGVVLAEWQTLPEVEQCLADADYDPSVFDPSGGGIVYSKSNASKRLKNWRWRKSKLEKEMKGKKLGAEAEAGNYAAAAEVEGLERYYKAFIEVDREVQIIKQAQIRLRCERLFNEKGGVGKFTPGEYAGTTTHALANFEKKHDLMGWGHFTEENIAFLALSPREAAYARLVRVLSERVVSSAGILEDGSARDWKPDFQYKDGEGNQHGLRDLAGEFTDATLEALGLAGDPDAAFARLAELAEMAEADPERAEGFGELLVAVKLPELPAYYAEDMAFSTVIDRGDVWYDFPYDDEGNKRSQGRKRHPHLTLYVTYEGQKIPLVHWRTTIGSWRTELSEGQEYYAYKNSDVGDRVWQTIMAAPVWIPPDYTPTKTLTKRKTINGRTQRVVNYDETGPGYMSAYGLVAAYHVKLREKKDGSISVWDNQIRTHGSVDYNSILRRYSHGCHRLYNMNAVRMFSMILQHREYVREGQTVAGVGRKFTYKDKEYTMRLDTRGYKYTLVEPIEVTVTEGRIRGTRQKPYTELMPKPGVVYEDTESEEDAEALVVEDEGA